MSLYGWHDHLTQIIILSVENHQWHFAANGTALCVAFNISHKCTNSDIVLSVSYNGIAFDEYGRSVATNIIEYNHDVIMWSVIYQPTFLEFKVHSLQSMWEVTCSWGGSLMWNPVFICQGNDQSNLNKESTGPVDKSLRVWTEASKNFDLIGRWVAAALDAHAMDAYYLHIIVWGKQLLLQINMNFHVR